MTRSPIPSVGYTIPIRRIQAFVGIALANGWDVNAILRDTGISPALLAEGRSRVTTEQLTALMQRLWRETDDELLGFGSGPVHRGTFRLLMFALLTAPDVACALQRFEQVCRALPAVPRVQLTRGPRLSAITCDMSGVDHPVDLLVDTSLAFIHRFLSWAIDQRIALHHVEVPYSDTGAVDDYDLIFGAPVVFDAPGAAIVFDSAVLGAPLVRSEEDLEHFLANATAVILARRDYGVSMADQVRRILGHRHSGPATTMDAVAAQLLMSPQTVRRRLREEGTSLREIRETIQRDAAIAGLSSGTETVAELSERLGFSEPSAFTRAFRRWTGSPPGEYRANMPPRTTGPIQQLPAAVGR